MVHNRFSLYRRNLRKGRSKRAVCSEEQPFTEEMRNILVEAFYLFPKAVPSKYFVNTTPSAALSSTSITRFQYIQDYVYDKTGVLHSIDKLRGYLDSMEFAKATGQRVWTCKARYSATSDEDSHQLSFSEQLLTHSFSFNHNESNMSSHDSSGDIFKMDDLTSAINLIATSEPASADCNAKENQAPTLPPILQSSSMSRRRLGTNIPSLQCHIGLPPPPADSYFKELMHPVSPRKGPRRSLGFTIKSPNLLSVRPTNLPAVPVTPVDQMINVPSQPPEAPRQSVKKPTAYGAEFEKAWGFSPDVMPPLTSPNLEDSPQVPSAALLDSVPITPVEQVMAVPNVPPKLPRRRTSTATARDPLSTAKCLPLNALYPSTQATPTQRSKITSPKLSMTCVPSHITVPRFSKLAISDTDHISPFIDVGKTPKPRNSASSRTPKPRPPPLFTLPARSTHVPTPRTQRPLSPASPLAHGPGVARLPLASPFWPAITGDNCSFAGVRTSTPLAGVAKRAPAETSAVGTPSYFNAPSYFVNN